MRVKRKVFRSLAALIFLFTLLFSGASVVEANELVDLTQYRGQSGTIITVIATGEITGAVWGNGIYTDDSDIGTAAVHAGALRVGETKTLRITILPGENSYKGTKRNGVETYEYGEWEGSFRFTDIALPLTSQTTTGGYNPNAGTYSNFISLQLNNPIMSVNGIAQEVDPGRGTTPIIISGRSMIPIRAVVEAMGGTLQWDNASQKITLTARGNIVEMWIGKKDVTVNGISYKMDVAPVALNGRTYVPLRFAAENLNSKVDWISSTNEAIISY